MYYKFYWYLNVYQKDGYINNLYYPIDKHRSTIHFRFVINNNDTVPKSIIYFILGTVS